MATARALQLWKLYGGLCGICGQAINRYGKKGESLTCDEILPRSKGGTRRLENQQPAHRRCNQAKSDKEIPPVIYPDRSALLAKQPRHANVLDAGLRKPKPPSDAGNEFFRVAQRCPRCGHFLEYNGQLFRCGYKKSCRYFDEHLESLPPTGVGLAKRR